MNKIKKNRFVSFVIIFLVYVLATVVGIATYESLSFDFYINLLIADVLATALTFVFSMIFNNSSVYDPYWSVAPMVIVVYGAIEKGLTLYTALLLTVVCLWGVRLTVNWAYTFKSLCHQDWRYTMIKEKTGFIYPLISLLGIHMFPTLIVYSCMLPVCFAIEYDAEITPLSVAFLSLSLFATAMQGVSDYQMHKYRRNRTAPFIRTGLWKYSRHPNYLGEVLMWWGIGLSFVSSLSEYWYLIFGAVANNLMFLFISIPMADKRQSKKDGYDEYKNQTNMLLPIKLKKQDKV